MVNSKLFKKLNEQMNIVNIKNEIKKTELTEAEVKEIEKKVIFENFNKNLISNINFVERNWKELEMVNAISNFFIIRNILNNLLYENLNRKGYYYGWKWIGFN